MKKLLLGVVAVSTISMSSFAQARMTLHEEVTGENCGPCAATNPDFWTLCNSGTNPSKLIHIAYMSPIPSSGWFYLRSKVVNDARRSYYAINSAPSGKYDGTATGSGHPGSFTQAHIDAEAAIASPFNITVTNTWDATYDSVITNVTITCVTAFTTSSTFNLRAALVQTVDFNAPPGSNGETHFENVVQDMYPSAAGTALPTAWTVGMSQSFTIRGKVPSFVEKGKSPFMVVWMQDELDKNIKQAGKATPLPPVPNDASVSAITSPGLVCLPNGSTTVSHSVTLKNTGSATLTSATVYYNLDGGTMMSTPWTGSLATGATAVVTMPMTPVTVAGPMYHYFYDSVANPNGVADQSINNNAGAKNFFFESTNALAMPYTTSYESADAGKFYFSDANNDGETWSTYTSTSGLGHTGTNAAGFEAYSFLAGESEFITLPMVSTSTNSAIDFWVAYCQYDATTDDRLELVYSTDCGANWTSLWDKAGSTLSTSAISTSSFVPSSSQYQQKTVDISAVPAGAMLGFRATSDYGNNIWVDDINIHATSSVNQLATISLDAAIYPNPAKGDATLSFNLTNATNVEVKVVDGLGRTVAVVTNENLKSGMHSFQISTASLAAGVYNVMINTAEGTATERLSVIK